MTPEELLERAEQIYAQAYLSDEGIMMALMDLIREFCTRVTRSDP